VRIGALADSSLVATRIGSVRRVVCGSPSYFSAQGAPKRPEELSALSTVRFDQLSSSEHWIFADSKSKRELRVPVRSRLSVNTAEAAIDAAAAGLGVTRVLSYQVAQSVLDGRIQIVLAEFEPEAAPVSLIHAGQELTPLKVRMLLDFAAPRLERVPNRQNRLEGILKRGRIMIHHVGWEGGQHGWRSPIRGICGSAWFERFRRAGAGMKWLGSLRSARVA